MGAGALEEVVALTDSDSSPRPIRAFFALPLPEAQRLSLSVYLAECAACAPEFRWVEAANLHLTLRFLGTIDRDLALAIARRIADHVLPAFRIELGELGTFKRGRMVRVVWAGLRLGQNAAMTLAGLVEAECAAAGLDSEGRPFAPHLTLARSREREGAVLPELPGVPDIAAWTADELVLFQSHLSPHGAKYEELAQVPLSRSD